MLENLAASSCISNVDSQSGSLFILLLNTLLASQCKLKDPDLYPPDKGSEIQDGEHFDFIIVGAGSAGSVVGSRLVETGKWKVLILEAGDLPAVTTEIPSLFFTIQLTNQTWKYETEPSDQSCLGFRNKTCLWPRGKLLGGCSTINAMLYIRGNEKDYNSWSEDGNEGWNYEAVMKYFKKSEKLLVDDLQHLDSYGKDGLLPLTRNSAKDPLRNVILQSVREIGYKILKQEGGNGFFESLQTIENGVRANAAKAFLGSVVNSNKLKLAMNAHVKKVIIEENRKKAKGVSVKIGEKSLILYADKEVIMSAGAINSPQILMLSGLGPKQHLQNKGIHVIQDLAIGKNLQDHLVTFIFSKLKEEALENVVIEDEIYNYFMHRKGSFSNTGVSNIQGFLNTKNDSAYPDVQYTFLAIGKNDSKTVQVVGEGLGLSEVSVEVLENTNKEAAILTSLVILLQPKSKGEILLKTKDPLEHPIIRTGYLTNEEDITTLLRGIDIARAQLKSESFRQLNAEILDMKLPNCNSLKFDSVEYWSCFVRNMGTTLYHPTSTCKMGPSSDKNSVVDSRLRLHGLRNLRVIDASIMPNIVSGNTNAPCTMIGQKGADMIIEDYTGVHQEL